MVANHGAALRDSRSYISATLLKQHTETEMIDTANT